MCNGGGVTLNSDAEVSGAAGDEDELEEELEGELEKKDELEEGEEVSISDMLYVEFP